MAVSAAATRFASAVADALGIENPPTTIHEAHLPDAAADGHMTVSGWSDGEVSIHTTTPAVVLTRERAAQLRDLLDATLADTE